jgi:predicted N-formylglutamate amidohydrolase
MAVERFPPLWQDRTALKQLPYRVLRPLRLSRLLITCEHAGRELLPDMARDRAAVKLLGTHWGWDIGVWQVVREVSKRLNATAIGGRYSRLVVDLNRDPTDATLIRSECDAARVPFNRRLSTREIGWRVSCLHAPYHAEIDLQLARRAQNGVRPFLMSFHSFTPFLNPKRRKFDAGVLYSDHSRLAGRMGRELMRQGFSVRYNRPYSGREGLIYAVGRHGYNHQVPYLELEFNQRSLGNDEECRRVGRRAAAAIQAFLATLP